MRDIDSDRLEDGILAAQKGIKNGTLGALQALPKLISTRARLNGYLAPQKMELSGKAGGPVEIKTADDYELSKMLERLTQKEAVEFLRLFNKAKGVSVEPSEPRDVRRKDDEENKG
jgi:hypothetical protein